MKTTMMTTTRTSAHHSLHYYHYSTTRPLSSLAATRQQRSRQQQQQHQQPQQRRQIQLYGQHRRRHLQQCRAYTTAPRLQNASIFAARASAKEGLWVAQNSPSAIPPAAAVRLSPAVQLLAAENSLVSKQLAYRTKLATPDSAAATITSTGATAMASRDDDASTAEALRRRVRTSQQQQQMDEHRREAMATVRARERERNRAGQPIFWIENKPARSAPAAGSATRAVRGAPSTLGGSVSRSASPMADVARLAEQRRAGGAGSGKVVDSSATGLVAFLALASLPIAFGLGRRYEGSKHHQVGAEEQQAQQLQHFALRGAIGATADASPSATTIMMYAQDGQGSRRRRDDDVVVVDAATSSAPVLHGQTPTSVRQQDDDQTETRDGAVRTLGRKQSGSGSGWFWSSLSS